MLFNRLESNKGYMKSGNSEVSNSQLKNSIAALANNKLEYFDFTGLNYINTFLFTTVIKKDQSFFILNVHLDPLDDLNGISCKMSGSCKTGDQFEFNKSINFDLRDMVWNLRDFHQTEEVDSESSSGEKFENFKDEFLEKAIDHFMMYSSL